MNKGIVIIIVIAAAMIFGLIAMVLANFSGGESEEATPFDIPRMEVSEEFELEDLFNSDNKEDYKEESTLAYENDFDANVSDSINILESPKGNQNRVVDSLQMVIQELSYKIDSLMLYAEVNKTQSQSARSYSRPKRTPEKQTSSRTEPPQPAVKKKRSSGINFANSSKSSVTNSTKISAQVYGDHPNVKQGDRVRFITNASATINGKTVKKNTVLWGIAKLNGRSMDVVVTSIPTNNGFIDKRLKVFTSRGNEGFYISNTTNNEIGQDAKRDASGQVDIELPLGLGQISKDALRKKIEDVGIPILNAEPVFLKQVTR